MKTRYTLIAALVVFSASNLLAQTEQWVTKAPMPTPRHASGAAVVNDTIYVIGGTDSLLLNTSIVEAYDPITDTWTTKSPMPTARGELGVAAVNGKIYAIGGYNGVVAVNTVEEYTPATDTWAPKTPMPTARSVFSVEVINDTIYAVGGWPGNLNIVEAYDPVSNSWSTKTPIAVGKHNFNSCAVLNDTMYFIGGKNALFTAIYQTNDAYDPPSDTWTPKANIPQPVWAGAATEFNNNIHYIGGTDTIINYGVKFNENYVYDPLMNLWSPALPLPYPRARHIAVTVNCRIYVIGGRDSLYQTVDWNRAYNILPAPVATTANICNGDSILLQNAWQTTAGVYYDTLAATGGCDSIVETTLSVTTVDTSVTAAGDSLTANATSVTYQWLDCDNSYFIISGETSQTYSPTASGNYAVQITDGSCTDTSSCYTITVGIEEITSITNLTIFPNPNSGQFVIEMELTKPLEMELEMLNVIGQVIYKESLGKVTGAYQKQLNLKALAKGIYTLQMVSEEGTTTRKIILE